MDVDLDDDHHAPATDADGMDVDMPAHNSPQNDKVDHDADMVAHDDDTPMEGDEDYEGEYHEGDEEYYEDEEMHDGDDAPEGEAAEGYTGDGGLPEAVSVSETGEVRGPGGEDADGASVSQPDASGAASAVIPATASPLTAEAPPADHAENMASATGAGTVPAEQPADAHSASDEGDDKVPRETEAAADHTDAAGTAEQDGVNGPEPAEKTEEDVGAEKEVEESAGGEEPADVGEEDAEDNGDLDELLTIHNLPPVLIHPPSGPPKLLFWTPEDYEVFADIIEAELDILLEGENEKYGDAKLDVVLAQIKQELASTEGVPSGVEVILEEKQLNLKMGEHDKHLSQVTLLELLQVYHSCELPLPVHLYVTFEPSRFYDRFEAIRRELVVRAERRKLGGEATEGEEDDYLLAEGDVGDDEGYESGEDAEEGEEEDYEEGDEAGEDAAPAAAAAGQKEAADGESGTAAADNAEALTADDDAAVVQGDKGSMAGGLTASTTETRNINMAAVESPAEVPLGDVEVNALHEQEENIQEAAAIAAATTVVVPDEVTASADEMSEMPDPQVPVVADDAVLDTAPNPEDTLAPEDAEAVESGVGGNDEDEGEGDGGDAEGGADDEYGADEYVEGEEGEQPAEDDYGFEGEDGEPPTGDDYGLEAIADQAVAQADDAIVAQAKEEVIAGREAGELPDPGNPLVNAVEEGVIDEELAKEAGGEQVEAALLEHEAGDGDEAAVEPEAQAAHDLNPFEDYHGDGEQDTYGEEDDEGTAVDEADIKASVLSVKRPADEDEDEGVDVLEPKRPREA